MAPLKQPALLLVLASALVPGCVAGLIGCWLAAALDQRPCLASGYRQTMKRAVHAADFARRCICSL